MEIFKIEILEVCAKFFYLDGKMRKAKKNHEEVIIKYSNKYK